MLLIKKQNGFTLIEAMVVVAILAVLVTLGLPLYRAQELKGYRSDAYISIQNMAQRQERWKTQTGTYSNNIDDVGGADTALNRYTLALSNVTADTYTITATAQDTQLDDTTCRSISLTHAGLRSSTDSGGTTKTGADSPCWPK